MWATKDIVGVRSRLPRAFVVAFAVGAIAAGAAWGHHAGSPAPHGAGSDPKERAIAGALDRSMAMLAKGPQGLAPPAGPAAPALLVFVSFSLPDATLERLVQQCEAAGCLLLLRGLEDKSMMKTAEHARRLIGTRRVGLQIDPQSFKHYGVKQAPTFVLARGSAPADCGGAACADAGKYLSVAGDVSVDFALRHIEASDPRFAPLARKFLDRIGGQP